MSRDSSRNPSGSSSAHSPTTPPSNPHSSRLITPTTTGNMLSVNVGSGNGLMGYNSGWQVWGGGSPSSQRNPSISSVVSAGDISSFPGDSGYRGPIREGWTSSRPASGTWDEDVNQAQSPHSKDFPQSHEAQSPLSLHPPRQRQASAAPFSSPSAPRTVCFFIIFFGPMQCRHF
ncbi:hypothetical protein BDP27DRAFT_42025 [Rhodocollybia butyracea]|uniref:Uncharacterized protein n=1 Tax=Rhodocollybia butyracea TaxID=206335 RepID=A0A9P5Q7W4_9AGAR|nr:hypothetical protein BDP27DRAFT_42025 [Rhodocollybia butyracea]